MKDIKPQDLMTIPEALDIIAKHYGLTVGTTHSIPYFRKLGQTVKGFTLTGPAGVHMYVTFQGKRMDVLLNETDDVRLYAWELINTPVPAETFDPNALMLELV